MDHHGNFLKFLNPFQARSAFVVTTCLRVYLYVTYLYEKSCIQKWFFKSGSVFNLPIWEELHSEVIFSCHEVASSGTTNVLSVCLCVCLSVSSSHWITISLYLCQFNSDLYITLNLSSCALVTPSWLPQVGYPKLVTPSRLPQVGYTK